MSLLERAIELAVQHHKGQRGKRGEPYILHPLYLMMQMEEETAMITAVLHDTIEDTPLTLDQLRDEGFSEPILTALRLLTHEEELPYDDYITRLQGNPLARAVKLADLSHNMDVRRLPRVTPKDQKRIEQYHRAWQQLQGYEAT